MNEASPLCFPCLACLYAFTYRALGTHGGHRVTARAMSVQEIKSVLQLRPSVCEHGLRVSCGRRALCDAPCRRAASGGKASPGPERNKHATCRNLSARTGRGCAGQWAALWSFGCCGAWAQLLRGFSTSGCPVHCPQPGPVTESIVRAVSFSRFSAR